MLVLALQFSKGGAQRSAGSDEAGPTSSAVAGRELECSTVHTRTLREDSLKTEEKIRLGLEAAMEANLRHQSDSTEPASAPTGIASEWVERVSTFTRDELLRKEVIQPHLPVRLPCYDFTPITDPTFDGSFLAVRPPASGVADFRGVTGGVYKARERIHPGVLIRDY